MANNTKNGTKDWDITTIPRFNGMRAYILGGAFDSDVVELFAEAGFKKARTLTEADIVVFTGGSDVSPHLYGQDEISGTYCNKDRDIYEEAIYRAANKLGLPKVGICRGAQFLWVMNGGSLYQDIDGHAGNSHPIIDIDEDVRVIANSYHHQSIIPADHLEILAVTENPIATYFKTDKETIKASESPDTLEIEAGVVERTRCFLVQGHPEVGNSKYRSWFFHKLRDFLEEWGMAPVKESSKSSLKETIKNLL